VVGGKKEKGGRIMADNDMLKITLDQLEGLGLADMEEILQYGLEQRAEAKTEKDAVEERIKSINDMILPIMVTANIGSVSSPLGTLVYQHSIRSTINKDELINAMLGKGWDAADVADVIRKGSKESVSDTLSYRKPPKKRE
jgi:hypothetical protein